MKKHSSITQEKLFAKSGVKQVGLLAPVRYHVPLDTTFD